MIDTTLETTLPNSSSIPSNSLRESFVDVAWGRLCILSSGPEDGIPVIALHGWLDNAASFHALRQRLPQIRFISVEMAGHGKSDHRPQGVPYYMWDNAHDLHQLLDVLGLEKVFLLGHSMGAGVCSLFAGMFPERVLRLGLIESIAPLVYAEDSLAETMAGALLTRKRRAKRGMRVYASSEDAVEVRKLGRFPLDDQQAKDIVSRAVMQKEDGYHWRADPALALPSVLRMTDGQLMSYLTRIAAPTWVLLGKQGMDLPNLDWQLKAINDIQCVYEEGNHHLHMYPAGADTAAKLIRAWYA